MKVCGPHCKGCVHYRGLSTNHSKTSRKCCHYLLDTGRRRVFDDKRCYSREERWTKTIIGADDVNVLGHQIFKHE